MVIVERSGRGRTRSIRIDEAYDDELKREAEKRSISVSKLIEVIIDAFLNYENKTGTTPDARPL